MLRRKFIAFAAALAVSSPAVALPQSPGPVSVFAAASLKNVFDAIGAAWTARSKVPVHFSYGASSALARQIESDAPADVFVSADVDWMDYVAAKGLIVAGSRRNLLTNHLALIAPARSAIRLRIGPGMPLAQALGGGRLAVAGPEVPAGKYAKASLTALGVWPSVEGKLAPAENVRAALTFISRGETPLGIVYDTDARIEPGVRIVGLFPDSSHPPILYPVAVLKRGAANPNAAAFVAFLRGPQAAALYKQYGFRLVAAGR